MNLTQMREFNFEKRAMAAQVLYNGKLDLADQDIINIIFHGFPGNLPIFYGNILTARDNNNEGN